MGWSLFASMAFGDMPMGAWLLMHASCIRWSMEAGLLLMVLWRSEPHVRGEKLLAIPANKLEVRPPNQEVVASEDEARSVVLLLSCSHQGGGGVDWKGEGLLRSSRWGCVAAISGAPQWWRLSAAVILGRCGHSVLRYCVYRSFFNLQAGVPRWRPFRASCRSSTPSRRQVVRPRQCQGGRRWRLNCGGEDEAPDCFSYLLFRVLCASIQDCVVMLFFYQSPVCKMYPPTML